MGALRWLGRNLSTLLLAFILALVVWGSAVTSADPNQERVFSIPIEVDGRGTDIEIISELPDRMAMTLFAPDSILDQLAADTSEFRTWINLSGLSTGTHEVPVEYVMPADVRPLRLISVSPKTFEIALEQHVAMRLPIQTSVIGEPALGYQTEEIVWSDQEVTITGRSSNVKQVTMVEASLDISGANENIEKTLTLLPRDSEGNLILEVDLKPRQITATQAVTLRGGYRNMVVKVVTIGQVAEGYRQSNIAVSPSNVMIFAPDPILIDQLPGYIETQMLDLTAAIDDLETSLALNLPEGVSVIGDPNVLVQVGVTAIEGSINISRQVEVIGILPEFVATVAPETVEIILYGPIPMLETMTAVDVRVIVDLTELEPAVYQLQPEAIVLPDRIRVQVISPETLEVEIIPADQVPTPMPTSAPEP
jgi:YbbR domain-containing protein